MNEELKLIISAEISKLKQGVDKAKSQITNFKDQVKKASKDVDAKFAAIGEGMKTAASKIGVGVAAAGGALLALAGSTEEYRNQQAQLVTAFETAGASAETAKSVYNDLYRVLGDGGQAQEAAQHLAKITTEEKALSEWTTITQGIYAQFGASLPIESLLEAANETAKVGQVTGTLADALNWTVINSDTVKAAFDGNKKAMNAYSKAIKNGASNEDALNEALAKCNSEAEREKVIRTLLNGMYAEAAGVYETNNAQVLAQRDAQASLQEKLALLGEALAPVITAFTNFATEALAVVVPYIQNLAETYLPLLKDALTTVSDVMGTVFQYLNDNWGTVLTVAGVIGGIAAAIALYNTVAAIKAAMVALEVTSIWGLVSAYAAQAAAMAVAIAPYVLIVAAIAAVIAIIVLCVKNWDTIKEKTAEVWAAIKAWVTEAATAVKSKIQDLATQAVIKFNNMKTQVTNVVTNIVSSIKEKFTSAKETALNMFESIRTGINNKMTALKNIVKNAIDNIKKKFDFDWSLPEIKLPHFSVSGGKAPWGFMGEGSLPKISIDWYAKGGVFDSPTFFNYGGNIGGLGENGAEAIVPLEKNTKWLDRLADMLGDKLGINQPIVLNVDGKTFAQVSVDSINQLTRLRGSIPLNII